MLSCMNMCMCTATLTQDKYVPDFVCTATSQRWDCPFYRGLAAAASFAGLSGGWKANSSLTGANP
jgi:hypothetical protein